MDQVYVHPDLRCAWHGPSLLVLTPRGECGDDAPFSGYFFREARHLRTLRFEINGDRPFLCETAIHEPERLSFTFIHPELTHFSGGGSALAQDETSTNGARIPHRALDIQLDLSVSLTGLDVALAITNRTRRDIDIELAWILSADFADILEVESETYETRAPVRAEVGPHEIRFVREDSALPYSTHVCAVGPVAWRVQEDRLVTGLRLVPQATTVLALVVQPVDPLVPMPGLEREQRWRNWRDQLTRIEIPGNSAAESIVRRNVLDVASFPLLEGRDDEFLAPQAGIPLYPALFGRDALTATWQSAVLDRGEALESTLTRLGRLQGTHDDAERDEEPGRILQQTRSGPLSRTGTVPFGSYYGDYASPFMYVIALAHLYAWNGDKKVIERHWDTSRRILDWARERGDLDGDGYLEYRRRSTKGAENQGWKDSGDAVVYDDGSVVRPPIGTCELQGYWYAAQQVMAVMSWAFGARGDAGSHWRAAMELKERFNRDWWVEDAGFVALAMDPEKRLVLAPGSNAGHCLATGIIDAAHLPRVVGRLFQSDIFSGWGIRTLSADHAAYDPVSYHRGSVWAVENATIVFGLRRFGFDARALDLSRALFDLAALYPDGRIPETVGGYARSDRSTPGLYPRANPAQLWNASAFPLLIHSILGLQPVAPLDLLVVDPILPSWLPEVILRGLRLAGATVSLRFWRDKKGESHAEILHKRGTFHLIRQPPPESLSAGLRDRFSALADRVLHH